MDCDDVDNDFEVNFDDDDDDDDDDDGDEFDITDDEKEFSDED